MNYEDSNKCNAMHIACSQGYSDIVENILFYWSRYKITKEKKVFNIDCKDTLGLTSLMKASINGHLDIV